MAIEVPHNEEIFGGGKNGERKGVGCWFVVEMGCVVSNYNFESDLNQKVL